MVDKIQSDGAANYSQNVSRVERHSDVTPNQIQGQGDGANHQRFASASTEVDLSSDARLLQQALSAAKDVPDVRGDVVHQIQSQLATNSYEIDFEGLADRLLPLFQ